MKRWLFPALNHLLFIAIAVFFLAPLTWLVTSAFRENPSVWVEFKDFTLGNFPRVLTGDTARWIRNSLFIAITSALIATGSAFLAAYPFARFDFRGKTAALFLLVLSMTIPLSAVMLPTFSLARFLHLQNTLFGVSLVIAARQMPMGIWIVREFIASIPIELEEAAWVDGASRWTTIRRIIFPLCGPGLAVIGLMSFVAGWGDFTTNLILISSEKLYPISMGIYKASIEATSWGYVSVDYGVMCAIGMLYMIPPMVAFLFTHRYLVKGMVLGAVKQ
ncbi:carbohydrate ABC transporter permease [Candidatus Bipolaricaulota bacterium]|nr:carbohydrate ABC transporter permease [Candidatus Bipolaricaulota bacterium]